VVGSTGKKKPVTPKSSETVPIMIRRYFFMLFTIAQQILASFRGCGAENPPRSHFYSYNFKSASDSGKVKTIGIHHLVPGMNKVFNKFLLSICSGIYFGNCAKLGI